MKLSYWLGGVAIALSFGACKKSSGSIDAFMKLDTDKAEVFKTGGEDCDAKAKAVGPWRTAHSKEYKALREKLNAEFGKEPPKDVIAKYGDQMKKNKSAVIDAMMACTGNAAFDKMMDDTADADK